MKRVSASQRREITKRAQRCCEYCYSPMDYVPESFSVDHIIPKSKGGTSTLDNLALACQGCNGHKYKKTEGRDSLSGELTALYHPRQQRWREHFTWNEDLTIVVGLTATGRATVEVLHLNRQPVVNLRQMLATVGKHPGETMNEDKPGKR